MTEESLFDSLQSNRSFSLLNIGRTPGPQQPPVLWIEGDLLLRESGGYGKLNI
jgi:hypothetical protein